jgi:DNA-directed RNA polymerase specialized sigma24 family protein
LQRIIRSDDAGSAFGAMASTAADASLRIVPGRRHRRALVDASAAHVYGAAIAAAADPEAAADVTHEAMVAAAAGQARADARSLIEHAVLRAVQSVPHPTFAAMRVEDREAVALARLAGYSVDEIADALAIPPAEARSRMTNGVRALAAAVT